MPAAVIACALLSEGKPVLIWKRSQSKVTRPVELDLIFRPRRYGGQSTIALRTVFDSFEHMRAFLDGQLECSLLFVKSSVPILYMVLGKYLGEYNQMETERGKLRPRVRSGRYRAIAECVGSSRVPNDRLVSKRRDSSSIQLVRFMLGSPYIEECR